MIEAARVVDPRKEAALLRIQREKARRHLIPYMRFMMRNFQEYRHQAILAEKLEQVELYVRTEGKEGIGRLMVFLEPRVGKTEECSKALPAWLLGRNPDKRIITTAYGQEIAQKSSKAIRDQVMDDRYAEIFGNLGTVDEPVELSEDSRAKNNWDLAAPHKGGVDSAGVGGALVGKGAHLLIVDDPIKGREDASEANLKNVWTWWTSVAHTRLEKGAAILIVQTRWDVNDLSGLLLQMMANDPGAEQYEVVFMPALALEEDQYPKTEEEFLDNLKQGIFIPYKDPLGRKPGQALCPEKYNEAYLEQVKNLDEYEFSAQYEQLPRPLTGNFLPVEQFEVVKRADVPSGLQWAGYTDLAMGETRRADWNSNIRIALDEKTGNVFLRDRVRVHDIYQFMDELERVMLLPEEKGTRWAFETNGFQSLVMHEFSKKRKLVTVSMEGIKVEKDKVTRATPIRTRGLQGKIKLVEGPWIKEFLIEAREFPNGKHDDQIDSISGGLEMVAEIKPRGKELIGFA